MNKKILLLTVLLILVALSVAFCAVSRQGAEPSADTAGPSGSSEMTSDTQPSTDHTLPEGEGVGSEDDLEGSGEEIFDDDVTEPSSSATEPEKDPEDPATEPDTQPTTEPSVEPGTEPDTQPSTEPSTEPVTGGNEDCGCAYAAYLKMSAAEQEAYMESFASPLDFIAWCRSAEAQHKQHDTSVEVEGGDLDIGDFMD